MQGLVEYVQRELAARSDPQKAQAMAEYMKTEMPFYGVQAGTRRALAREAGRRFPPGGRDAYEAAVLALWGMPHREEKYVAIAWAREHTQYIDFSSLPLYELMIREGAWWDLVDEISVHLVGDVLRSDPAHTWPVLDRWIDDENLWIRRSALICQNSFGELTDEERLFRYCLARAPESEFFIRKAIGWALREYSYAAPEVVRDFLLEHRAALSGVTFREGGKRLSKIGML